MSIYKKLAIVAFVAIFSLTTAPSGFVFAQDSDDDVTSTPGTSSLAEQIAGLLEQVRVLQARLAEIRGQAQDVRTELREARQLTRELSRGMSGEDVTELQELLASDTDLYPEGLVTGFFGPLTASAVERFQERFGMDRVGRVGPLTLRTINRLLNKGRIDLDEVLVDSDESDELDSDVDLSEFTPGTTGVLVCHMRGRNAHTIAVGGPAVQAHIAHGDSLGACDDEELNDQDDDDDDDDDADEQDDDDDSDDDDDDDEDTTAPVISDVSVSDIDSDSVSVSWDTDEDSDGTVYYSTEEGFEIDDDGVESVDSDDFDDNHEVELTDLESGTEYFFLIIAADGEGNEGTTSENSFTTL